MKQKSIFIMLSLVFSLAIQGCYTQLAWFYPSPEEEEEIFEPYSRAGNRPNLSLYAQETGSTMPLSYSMMHNRFNPFTHLIMVIPVSITHTIFMVVMVTGTGWTIMIMDTVIAWVVITWLSLAYLKMISESLLKAEIEIPVQT